MCACVCLHKFMHMRRHFLGASFFLYSWVKGVEEEKGRKREVWLKSRAVNSEDPAMSWGDKKRHHLKLTQLFNCECHSIPPPPLFVLRTHAVRLHAMSMGANHQSQTHNFPKTTNQATTTENQDQCYDTQGKSIYKFKKKDNSRGAFPTTETQIAVDRLLCLAVPVTVIVLVTQWGCSYSYCMIHKSWDGMSESRLLATNWTRHNVKGAAFRRDV